jgi:hypothetical protein
MSGEHQIIADAADAHDADMQSRFVRLPISFFRASAWVGGGVPVAY